MFRIFLAFLVEPWKLIFGHRRMLWSVYMGDLRSRFAVGNVLGWAWLVLYPLLFLGAYSVLFVGLLSIRLPEISSTEYILLIFAGFISWWALSEVITNGIALVHSNIGLLKNTLFPIEMLSVRITVVAVTQMIVSVMLMLVAYTILGKASIAWFQLVPLMVIQVIASIGVCWILATLGAFIKDLIQVVNVINMLMLLVTPIGYTEDMVSEEFQAVLSFNPVTYLIRAYRDCLSLGQWSDPLLLGGIGLVSLILFYVGYFFFSRLKAVFSDLV